MATPEIDFIESSFPVIDKNQTIAAARAWMRDQKYQDALLMDESQYISLIRYKDLIIAENDEMLLTASHLQYFRPFIFHTDHPYNAAIAILDFDISILPVLNKNDECLGVLSHEQLLKFFAQDSGLNQIGGIVVLNVKAQNYSLSEIARICESNDISILNVEIKQEKSNEWIDVILKTNRKRLQGLIAAFERYEYDVKFVYGDLSVDTDMEERYHSLMRYINM